MLVVTTEVTGPARLSDPGEDAGRKHLRRYQNLLQVSPTPEKTTSP